MKEYKLAIVGATGLVGRKFLKFYKNIIYQFQNVHFLQQENLLESTFSLKEIVVL